MTDRHIYAVMSCDTEFLPPWHEGSWLNQAVWSFASGVERLCEVLDNYNIKATFFTQGTVAEQFPEEIRSLTSQGHLIGSHGYNHENYGNEQPQVWTKEEPVFVGGDEQKKRELLMRAHNILKDTAGYEPEVFVAPFNKTDKGLLKILDGMNYKVDCSFHNYSLGLNSFPFRPLGSLNIIEIPLTVLDFDSLGRKGLLEAFTFDFNSSIDKLMGYLDESRAKFPFTVLLITSHPYEFLQVEIPHPASVLIVGERKIASLDKLIRLLKKEGVEFVNPLTIRKESQKFAEEEYYEM